MPVRQADGHNVLLVRHLLRQLQESDIILIRCRVVFFIHNLSLDTKFFMAILFRLTTQVMIAKTEAEICCWRPVGGMKEAGKLGNLGETLVDYRMRVK